MVLGMRMIELPLLDSRRLHGEIWQYGRKKSAVK
jgi:hypothetical protein